MAGVPMTAALIAVTIALAAAACGAIVLALKGIDAERRCGDARADEAAMAARYEATNANLHNETNRADDEKRRADALDDTIARYAAAAAGPVAGAEQRLLAEWANVPGKPGGAGAGAVPAKPAAAAPGPDELLKPGAG